MGCLLLAFGQMRNVLPVVRIAVFDLLQMAIVWTLLAVPFGDLVGGAVDDFIQTTEAISRVLLLKYLAAAYKGHQQHQRDPQLLGQPPVVAADYVCFAEVQRIGWYWELGCQLAVIMCILPLL